MRFHAITLALAASLAACLASLAALAEPDDNLREALDAALEDERHAIAFYAAVLQKHGPVRPFTNIIRAERRHEAALLRQYDRLALTPPPNLWKDRTLEPPATVREAADKAVVWEIRNARMYEELIAGVDDPQVIQVFENLRRASQERHLPAFRRHSSGWSPVDVENLTDAQKSQRDRALRARDAMFGRLFQELAAALAQGGAPAAIRVCAERAPAIAETVAEEHDVRIGRTSWKLRNPNNLPPAWADLLVDARPTEPVFLTDRTGRLGSLTPIRLASACVQCHGPEEQLAPDVRTALDDLYPEDRATGFEEGDLRGWFWVETPAGMGE